MSDPEDLKIRSHDVTDFPNRAPARAMLRATGMTDDDWDKPQVAVVSSWNEVTPCNMPLDRTWRSEAKDGVRDAGGYPDRVQHHRGVRRHLDGPRGHACLARVARGHRRLGRDRDARRAVRRHGQLRRLRQVAARHDDGRGPLQRARRVPVRRLDPAWQPQRPRARHHLGVRSGRRSCHGSDRRRGARRHRARRPARPSVPAPACSPPTRWRRSARRSACRCPAPRRRPRSTAAATTTPTPRAPRCSTCCARTSVPATSSPRRRSRTRSPWSWRSAVRPTRCCTCSRSRTRPVSSCELDDFNKVAARVPHLADTKPHGSYEMVDIDRVGGVPVVMAMLLEAGLLHVDEITVTGQHGRREPGADRPSRPRRRRRAPAVGSDPRHRRHRGAARVAGAERLGRQGRRHRLRRLRRACRGSSTARPRRWRRCSADASTPVTSSSSATRAPRAVPACARCSRSPAR